MYSVTNWSITFAVDARTGKEKWRWDPEVNRIAVQPKVCCGVVNRGLAIYDGKIFVPVIDGRLEALDAATGKVLWESRVAYSQDNYTLTMAPRVVRGRVLIGVSGAEYPVRGFIAAYDANTGRQGLEFFTVPGDLNKPEDEAMKKAAATWDPHRQRSAAGALFGTLSRMILTRISFILVPEMRDPGRRSCAMQGAKTICTFARSLRSRPTPANTSGTSRWFRAIRGITTASNNSYSPI